MTGHLGTNNRQQQLLENFENDGVHTVRAEHTRITYSAVYALRMRYWGASRDIFGQHFQCMISRTAADQMENRMKFPISQVLEISTELKQMSELW